MNNLWIKSCLTIKYHHMDKLKHMHNSSNLLDHPQDDEV